MHLGLGTDTDSPGAHSGVRHHTQAFDQYRVLPLITVLPGKATGPDGMTVSLRPFRGPQVQRKASPGQAGAEPASGT